MNEFCEPNALFDILLGATPDQEQTINEVVRIVQTIECSDSDLAAISKKIKDSGAEKAAEKVLVAMFFDDPIVTAKNTDAYQYLETEEERKNMEHFYWSHPCDTIFNLYCKDDEDVKNLIDTEYVPYQPVINGKNLAYYLERLGLL